MLRVEGDQREEQPMDIRGLAGALDAVLGVTITVICVVGAFVVWRYALSIAFR
jgi:hypothetical protein